VVALNPIKDTQEKRKRERRKIHMHMHTTLLVCYRHTMNTSLDVTPPPIKFSYIPLIIGEKKNKKTFKKKTTFLMV
jgi:hypothetical protein